MLWIEMSSAARSGTDASAAAALTRKSHFERHQARTAMVRKPATPHMGRGTDKNTDHEDSATVVQSNWPPRRQKPA